MWKLNKRIGSWGGLLAALVALFKFGQAIFDWVERIAFVVSHKSDPGFLGIIARTMLWFAMMLASLPSWSPWAALSIGLVAIVIDSRLAASKSQNAAIVAAQAIKPELDRRLRITVWLTDLCVLITN
jgi:hypothetical protein